MGASPKTTDFLKECMADSLLLLMKEKPFGKITINEITQYAGVNRSTWFRNFETKNEALTFKLIQLWNRWADEHGIKERHRYTLENAKAFFDFNASIQDTLTEIYRLEQQSSVYAAFYQIMMPQYGTDPAECYEARFYSYGLFGLLDEWVRRGYAESVEEMVRIFYEVMDKPNEYNNA